MLPTQPPRRPRMYIHQPEIVFAAQVNLPDPAEYPITFLAYDTVTTGAYTDVLPGMTLLLGTTPGASDLGRQRVSTNSDAIVIRVGYSSRGVLDGELYLQDNAYITILRDRRVWAKVPFVDAAGEVFKDRNIAVGDNNEFPPPVANTGPDMAGTAEAGVLLVTHNGLSSVPIADGATITAYLWTIGAGTLTGGALSDASITVEYPPGYHEASLTVTDSNGKVHTAYCSVYVDDPADRQSIEGFTITGHPLTEEGQSMSVLLAPAVAKGTYYDGVKVLIWDREPGGSANRDHMLFTGWHDTEGHSLAMNETGMLVTVSFDLIDVGGRLSRLPGFPQLLEDEILRDPEIQPNTTWQFMPLPTIDKFTHFILHWHSTALEVADYFPTGTGADYPFVSLQVGGENLLSQARRLVSMLVPDWKLIVTKLGQLRTIQDWFVLDVADRPADILVEIQADEWSEVSFPYQRPPRVHALWGQALLTSTEYVVVDDDLVITEIRSLSPGIIYGQGLSESTHIEQLARYQADLNKVTGHRYARMNSRYGLMTIRVPGDTIRAESSYFSEGWIVLHVPEEYATPRGLATTVRGRPTAIAFSYGYTETGVPTDALVTLELETSGIPAFTWNPYTNEATEEDEVPLPITTPPSFGLEPTTELLAVIDEDGFLYRTSDFGTLSGAGGPTWTQHDLSIADAKVYSFVVDPWSPGYIAGSGTINGWVVTEAAIYRVDDFFGTPVATNVHTFSVAIDPADQRQTRTIQASFGGFFVEDNPWLLVISHYADEAGHNGTYALRSLDGGQTWLGETVVSLHYDTSNIAADPPTEVGVYTSPKTPGYAVTTGYVNTKHPPQAEEHISTDWGETWSRRVIGENPAQPLPILFIADETLAVLNYWTLGTKIAFTVFSQKSVDQDSGLYTLNLAGPADAVRMNVTGSHINQIIEGSGSTKATDHSNDFGGTRFVLDSNTRAFVEGGSQFDWQQVISRFVTRDHWDHGRQEFEAEYPAIFNGNDYFQYDMRVTAGGFAGSFDTVNILSCIIEITEIELEGGAIYTPIATEVRMEPGDALAGALHVPWADNANEFWVYSSQYRLFGGQAHRTIQAEGDNSTLDDVSPSSYGPIRSGFGIRAYDPDRTYMVMGAVENEGSLDKADALHGVFVSSDGGETWNQVLGPTAETSFTGKRGYAAAFSGSDRNAIYIWGAPTGVAGCIAYTANFGVAIDSREGNLGSFGIASILGIAGGPTGA